MSRTLLGLFLVGAVNRPQKRKRTNRENTRTIPGQIGKIPEKSEKDESRSGSPPPRLNPPPPCLAALDCFLFFFEAWTLVHHRTRSQIASDQRSQPITDTLITGNPAERAVLWFPIVIRLVHLAVPICAKPSALEKKTPDRDLSFDRAIRCTKACMDWPRKS